MELRTTFKIEPSAFKISYTDPVLFIGSCFASSIGEQLTMGRMPVMINPAGAVFNPVSVSNTLNTIISEKIFNKDDLNFYNDTYLSFYHYTDFSSENPITVIEKINQKSREALLFLKKARYLFITFGTARVYRWKETGIIVSNCHKIPASQFENELLTVNEIVELWSKQLDTLHEYFPQLNIVFTISPVRHWKDGAHENQVSKSVLFLAVEQLLSHSVSPQYFPAYEIVMDDLRDYRFYNDDMLHPSSSAVNYIWEAFARCYLEDRTLNTWNEVVRITKARNHQIISGSEQNIKNFAETMLRKISEIETKVPFIDFSSEREFFTKMRMPR